MDIFRLATLQLEKEGLLNKPKELANLLNRAIEIRRYLDLQERGKSISKGKRR